MKIKQEFLDLYKIGRKTVALSKVSELKQLFACDLRGRIFINLENSETNKLLGYMVINGYSIIKNPFVDITENITQSVKDLMDKFY